MKLTCTFALTVTMLLAASCNRARFVYEVPHGYVGWVTVSFDSECRDDISNVRGNVIKVSADGSACSRLEKHPRTTWVRTYYVDEAGNRVRELRSTGWGEGGMVWAEEGSLDGRTMRFFVGTEAQLDAAWKAAASKHRPLT